MDGPLITALVMFGVQVLLASLVLARRLPQLDFYRASAVLMCFATGLLASQGSWAAIVSALMAGVWMWAARQEPARRLRQQHLARQLRAMGHRLRE